MKLIFAGWFFVIVFFVAGTVSDNSYFVKVTDVSYFLPKIESYSLEEVQKQTFKPLKKNLLSSPNGKVWVKLRIPANAFRDGIQSVLFLGSSELLNFAQAWLVSGGEVTAMGSCDPQFQTVDCALPGNQFAFPVDLSKTDSTAEIYLKMDVSRFAFQNDLYFVSRAYFSKIRVFSDYFTGFSSGVAFLIFALALLFFIEIKQNDFLIFAIYALLSAASAFVNRGMWDAVRPVGHWAVAGEIYVPLFFATRIFEIYFIKAYFKMHQQFKIANFILTFLILATFASLITSVLPAPLDWLWPLWPHLVFDVPVIIMIILAYLIFKKVPMSSMFFWAWGMGLIGYLIWGGLRSNLIEPHWVFGYAPLILRPVHFFLLTFVVFKNLSELNLEVSLARARSIEGNIVKTLLRTLSHDLANTTQMITATTSLALSTTEPEQITNLLERTKEVISKQTKIINKAKQNYLNRNNGQILNLEMVNFNECLYQTYQIYADMMEDKELKFVNQLPNASIKVFAEDVSLTNHVLANLFSNAIKFSQPGKHISIKVAQENEETISFEFKDQGVGIDSRLTNSLFDSKMKVIRNGTCGEEGSGHGLLIARDYMHYFYGSIRPESQPGKGTSFFLTFRKKTV